MKKLVLFMVLLTLILGSKISFASTPAYLHKPDSLVDELLLRQYAEHQLPHATARIFRVV